MKYDKSGEIPLCEGCGCAGNRSCGHEPPPGEDCALDDAGFCSCCMDKYAGTVGQPTKGEV